MRARLALAAGAVAAAAAAGGAVAATPSRSALAEDPKGDVSGTLDLTRYALRRVGNGRLRASLTLATPFTAGGLRAGSGPPGSLCVKLWTVSDPPDSGPDYLVCATVRSDGKRLRGSVLRERANQLPERVATAKVTRPSARTLRLWFAQTAIGDPAAVDTAAEATAPGCLRITCVDTAPNAPATLRLRLRKPASGHA